MRWYLIHLWGVGATAIACKELNRQYIGIELDEHYYNIAVNRVNDYICA